MNKEGEKLKRKNTEIYVLRLRSDPRSVEGVLQLRQQEGMLIMDLVEIAPHNIGRGDKKFEYVAGCLIAFACRETFKLESNYKGFLTFESKTKLIPWYAKNYYAKVAMGQIFHLDPKYWMLIQMKNEYLDMKSRKSMDFTQYRIEDLVDV